MRRKRDSFFGTLKKRFSRSKIRSKSMEPGRELSAERDQSVGRSVSMERSTNISRQSGKPGDREIIEIDNNYSVMRVTVYFCV